MRAHLEWGLQGERALASDSVVCVVVDVMSFSTCVDIATARGAVVYPFHFGDHVAALAHAQTLGAQLAGRRKDSAARFTLSPPTLADLR